MHACLCKFENKIYIIFKKFLIFRIFQKFEKVWDVTYYHPLKESRPRDSNRLERKIGSGSPGYRQLGWLPPLKETFVGSLELLSSG